MSAFGSPWGDIDETRPGQPYIVDSNGWGWFMLLIIAALPFFVLGTFLIRMTESICAHPYLSIAIYLMISIVMGFILYLPGFKDFRALGVVATVISMMPFALVEGLYMVPYIIQHSPIAAAFEWLLATAIMGGITIFVLFIASLLENGIAHIVVAVLFLSITFLILNHSLSTSNEINWAVIASIYQWR